MGFVEKRAQEGEITLIDTAGIDSALLESVYLPQRYSEAVRTILFGRHGMVHLGENLRHADSWHEIQNQFLKVDRVSGRLYYWNTCENAEHEIRDIRRLSLIADDDNDAWFAALVYTVRACVYLAQVYKLDQGGLNAPPFRKAFTLYFMKKFKRFLGVLKEFDGEDGSQWSPVERCFVPPYLRVTCRLCGCNCAEDHSRTTSHQDAVQCMIQCSALQTCRYCGSKKWGGCPFKAACQRCCWCGVLCAGRGEIGGLQEMLQARADVNVHDRNGYTAWDWAVWRNDESMKALLQSYMGQDHHR